MKLTIDQKVLIRALERGAMASLSDEAQGDNSGFSPLIQAVRITVGDDLTLESGTNLIATKWSTKAGKDLGIDVKEAGSVLVPAKALYDWASKQTKSKIALTLSKLKTPEVVTTGEESGDLDYGSDQSTSIKKIGNLKLSSRDDTRTGNKWTLDCYEPTQLNPVDFSVAPDPVATIPTQQLADGIRNVAFAAQPKDYLHIFDSLVLERYNDSLYLAASDMHRAAIYRLDMADGIDEEFFTQTETVDGNTTLGQKILIPAVFLKGVVKNSDGAEISVSYDQAKNKIYLSQEGWVVRVSTIGSDKFNNFPTVASLMAKPYKRLGSISKGVLQNRLVSASLVNGSMVLFDFKKNEGVEDGLVVIHAVSESGHAPNVSNAPVAKLVKDIKAVWGVKHIMDVVKVLKDEDVSLFVPDDMGSVKITSEADKNFQYYSMTIDNPKYHHFFKED